jgi:hypothetical protein
MHVVPTKCARPDHRRVESSYEQGSPETALSSSDLKRFLFEALSKLGECGSVLAVECWQVGSSQVNPASQLL